MIASSVWIQRVVEAPSPCFLAVVLDLVSDSPASIPTVGLDIDAVALAMKMPVSQQLIDGFDLMLHVRWPVEAAAKVGKR